jgi:hypothetical protein
MGRETSRRSGPPEGSRETLISRERRDVAAECLARGIKSVSAVVGALERRGLFSGVASRESRAVLAAEALRRAKEQTRSVSIESGESDREEILHDHAARSMEIYEQCMAAGQYATALQALRDRARALGVDLEQVTVIHREDAGVPRVLHLDDQALELLVSIDPRTREALDVVARFRERTATITEGDAN